MMKSILPEQYKGATLPSAKQAQDNEKQEKGLDWRDMCDKRDHAAKHSDVELFPLSCHGEYNLKLMKERRPEFFASTREENLYRLFSHFRERFEIFEADCRDFEKFWYDMDMGRDLWAWFAQLDGGRSIYRAQEVEALVNLLIYPLQEVREASKKMREKMLMYFEAQAAFIRLNKSLVELEDEYRRRYAKQG